jgi:hypothetical protein
MRSSIRYLLSDSDVFSSVILAVSNLEKPHHAIIGELYFIPQNFKFQQNRIEILTLLTRMRMKIHGIINHIVTTYASLLFQRLFP